jgi:hypothetical protein
MGSIVFFTSGNVHPTLQNSQFPLNHCFPDSFGSVFFGPSKEQAIIMLDVLHKLRIRYILAQGVATEDIREVLIDKIQASGGRGLLVTWSPQLAILAHPVRPLNTYICTLDLTKHFRPLDFSSLMVGVTPSWRPFVRGHH